MEYVKLAVTIVSGLASIFHMYKAMMSESAYHASMAALFAVIAYTN